MKMNKYGFILTAILIPALYGLANAALWHASGGFSYIEDDLFIWMTSLFLIMLVCTLPRTVEILLGTETPAAHTTSPGEETASGDASPPS